MKVLVCGDRNWTNKAVIWKRLGVFSMDDELVEGEADGADKIAKKYWYSHLDKDKCYGYPYLGQYGRAGGPIRNQQMLDENPDIKLVIAFHNDISQSKGTKDMVLKAIKAGIPVEIIREETYSWLSDFLS